MEKILTVSVAAYNVRKTLAETLESLIVPEIMEKLEVYIINDGSTDNTMDVASMYNRLYPGTFYVIDKKNGGHGSTINTSLAHATGKYFKIVDGDDWVFSQNLSTFIEQLENTEADIVTTQFVEFYEQFDKSVTIDNALFKDGKTRNVDEFMGKRKFAMHEIAVKTSLLRENNISIRENCFYVDHEFMQYSIGYANTVCELDSCIYKYRIGAQGQSVSPVNRVKRISDQELVLLDLLSWYETNHSSLSVPKANNAESNITNMLTYILESYGYYDTASSKLVKRSLQNLWKRVKEDYSAYKIDKYGIAFHQGEQVGFKRKIMFSFQYLLITFNFCGTSLFLHLRHSRLKKQKWS